MLAYSIWIAIAVLARNECDAYILYTVRISNVVAIIFTKASRISVPEGVYAGRGGDSMGIIGLGFCLAGRAVCWAVCWAG